MTNDTPAPIGADALPRYAAWQHLCATGTWPNGAPEWAKNADGWTNDATVLHAVIEELVAALASAAQPAAVPEANVAAWMTPEGDRVVTEATMAGARNDGGAILSSLRPYSVPLVRASAAQPTTDGWLQAGGMLYRLTDERRPQNRDEINVTMADGSRSPEACSRRAGELLGLIRAAARAAKEGGAV